MRDVAKTDPDNLIYSCPDKVSFGSFSSASSYSDTGRLEPKLHQREAIRENLKVLQRPGRDVRASDIMACGTGKSLVAQLTAESLGNRTLSLSPSIGLTAQALKNWRINSKFKNQRCMVICSDESLSRVNRDDPIVTMQDLGAHEGVMVTTNPEIARQFLRDNQSCAVFSTYHSTPVVAKTMESRHVRSFDCLIGDEAHVTATREDKAFACALDNSLIRSRTRLFMTATPRVYDDKGNNDLKVFSMDDRKVYGDVAYNLPFSKAIERDLLTDYQIVIASIDRSFFQIGDTKREIPGLTRMELAELAFLKAAQKHHLSKVITFHSSVAKAHAVAADLEFSASQYLGNKKVWAHAVDGRMQSINRTHLLDTLAHRPTNSLSVMCNCRVLGVGIDVRSLDGIAFFDPRSSQIDVIQAVGRVIRKHEGKKIGTILIPVVIDPREDPEKILESSEFKKIWQIVRALKSHDDRLEERLKKYHETEPNTDNLKSGTSDFGGLKIDLDMIPAQIRRNLETRIVRAGLGLKARLLTVKEIVLWAEKFYNKYKSPPTQNTGKIEGISDSWRTIEQAFRQGHRGLKDSGFFSLYDCLKFHHPEWYNLDLVQICKWAEMHYANTQSPPIVTSGQVSERIDETWSAIHQAFYKGRRGLKDCGYGGLYDFLKSMHPEWYNLKRDLNLKEIDEWAIKYYRTHGKAPTVTSGPVTEASSDTWKAIDSAIKLKHRGIKDSRFTSLPHFLRMKHPEWYKK